MIPSLSERSVDLALDVLMQDRTDEGLVRDAQLLSPGLKPLQVFLRKADADVPVLGEGRPRRPDERLFSCLFIWDRCQFNVLDGVADVPLLLIERLEKALTPGIPSSLGGWDSMF